jgi:hypothetical protein
MASTFIDNPNRQMVAILTLRSRVKLEIKTKGGIRFRGPGVLTLVQALTGARFTRKADALAYLDKLLVEFDQARAARA